MKKLHPPNPHRGLERFPLLTDTDPGTDRCINVWIPDAPEYLELFGTALRWLMNGFKYERDLTHMGEKQAAAFIRAYSAHLLSDCGGEGVSITFRQTNCLLEYSTDDGATWATAYVGSDCLDWGVSTGAILGGSAIDDAISNGKLSPGQQQGPTTAPDTGFCKDYYVTLSANQKWICPVPINGNYTITVEECKGGWTPDPTHYWYCPSGETYTLGGCGSGTGATDSGDPLNTVNHMRLVGYYGSTWIDLFNTTYLVPSSVTTDQQLYLQANDSDISNNLGSVTFHITICHATWEHVWDFTVSDGGWSAFTSPITRAAYVAGRGWHRAHETDDYSDRVTFYINTPGSVDVTMTYMKAEVETCSGVSSIGLYFAGVAPYVSCADDAGEYTHQGNANQLLIDATMSRPNDCYVHRVTIRGLGIDPWA